VPVFVHLFCCVPKLNQHLSIISDQPSVYPETDKRMDGRTDTTSDLCVLTPFCAERAQIKVHCLPFFQSLEHCSSSSLFICYRVYCRPTFRPSEGSTHRCDICQRQEVLI
jgi:hypothetical protein